MERRGCVRARRGSFSFSDLFSDPFFSSPPLGAAGDACVHAAQSNTRPLCRRWLDYLPALALMRDRYSVHTVFLSTDDEEVARVAPRCSLFSLLPKP